MVAMSRAVVITILVIAAVGYFVYKKNYFSHVNAEFDHTPDGVSVTALDRELHDCKLSLTNDFEVKLPVLRPNQQVVISKYEFKQWNNTGLEQIKDLGPTIEFHLRCREGKFDSSEANRYAKDDKQSDKKAIDAGEVTESNK
jgi:hypothetical protein